MRAAKVNSRDSAIRRYRRSVQGFEIRDQVGALRVVLQAGVDHRRVRHHRARIGEVFVEGEASQVTPSLLWSGVYWKPGTLPAKRPTTPNSVGPMLFCPALPSGRCRIAP